MPIPLAAMAARTKRTRKREITFRPITAPGTFASDLYAEAYAPVVKAWEAAAELIVGQYERSLATMDGLTVDSPEDINRELSAVEKIIEALMISVTIRLEKFFNRLELYHRRKWVSNVLSATAIDVSLMVSPATVSDTIKASIQWNTQLVRDVSAQTRQRIANSVYQGYRNRTPAREIAKQISEATNLGRKRSLRIASDQVSKATSQLTRERSQEAGIEGYAWVSSGKVHFRQSHKDRDGKIFRWDEPPEDGHPGDAINCGCTSRARLSLDPSDEF